METAGWLSINKYEKILFSFSEWLKGSTERKERETEKKHSRPLKFRLGEWWRDFLKSPVFSFRFSDYRMPYNSPYHCPFLQ